MTADTGAPRVTFVVPCHDLGAYLHEALDSVFAQTVQDFDVIVVDDGSTDEATRRTIDALQRPRTRVFRTENRGLSAARNYGAARTEAEYLCALDADDRLAPTYLERSLAVLDADPSLAFASHWVRTFGEEERDWTPERCDLAAVLDMNTLNGAALIRRAAVVAAGGWDESFRDGCEDWDFWLTLLERGHRGTIIPEVLFHYRRRPGSMSRVMMQSDVHLGVFGQILAKHRESYRQHLGELTRRREADIARLLAEIHDLDLDHHGWLLPQIDRAREELSAVRAKVARVERERAREAELARLEGRAAALEHEVADLRGSMSWKITAPLRAVYGWLLRMGGRSDG
jgi:glycosyltransferase involved in cell wall biosynthesis